LKKTISSIIPAAAIIAAATQVVSAAVVIDFEAPSFTVGNLHGQMGYNTSPTGASVSTANPYSGSQHMRLSKETLGSTMFAINSYDNVPGTYHTTSVRFYRHDVETDFYMIGRQDSSTISWGIAAVGAYISIYQGSGTTPPTIPGAIPAGVYHELRVVYNPGDMTRDFYLNDVLIHHQTTGLHPGTSTNAVRASIATGSEGIVDVDDITFGTVPTPGSAALFSLAALAAARRKR
jgi:hypothetical protein